MRFKMVFIGLCLFLLPSCSVLFIKMYGLKRVKSVDTKMIAKFERKYNIPREDSYKIDSAYIDFIQTIDTVEHKQEKKNHYQPLQALYYQNEKLISYQVNCYAGGFPNLKWERDSIFESFPPKQQAPLDTILSLQAHLKLLTPVSERETFSPENYDSVVIVYWNKLMGRQSKRFIKIVQKNLKLAGNKKVKLLYVNNDILYLNDGF